MKQSTSLINGFSIIVGAFLLIIGIWGLSSDVVFGILTTNQNHAIIHIILGVLGIAFGIRQTARPYCIFLGVLLIAVGILRFIDGAGDLIVNVLNVNENAAYLNIVIGIAALASTYRSTEAMVDRIPDEDEGVTEKRNLRKATDSSNHTKTVHVRKNVASPQATDTKTPTMKKVHPVKKETPSTDKRHTAEKTETTLKTVHPKRETGNSDASSKKNDRDSSNHSKGQAKSGTGRS